VAVVRTIIVGLDAGHGGKDPGAIGGGMEEKKINMNVAKKVEQILLAKGYKVVMTRTRDTYLGLSQRVKMWFIGRVDIAISIHHNAGKGDGFDIIYQMNPKYTAQSKALAEILASEFTKLNNKHKVFSRESVKYPGKDHHTILAGPFPTIISELAFIDHGEDVKVVDTLREQHLEAEAIVRTVDRYFGRTA